MKALSCQPFADDHVHHAIEDGHIAAWAEGVEDICPVADLVLARVQDDDLGAALLGL